MRQHRLHHDSLCVPNMMFVIIQSLLLISTLTVSAQTDSVLEYEINEEVDVGTVIGDVLRDGGLIVQYDLEEGDYSRLEFTLHPMSQEQHGLLSINSNTGVLQTSQRLDREELCPYEEVCEVVADVGVVDVSVGDFTALGLVVLIRDINDNVPEFVDVLTPYAITVSESSPIGSSWPLPVAVDIDYGINGVQNYTISDGGGLFDISGIKDRDRGVFIECQLTLLGELDRESEDNYQVQMIASDGGEEVRTASLLINISVSDSNDHTPVFDQSLIELNVSEATEISTILYTLHAHDRDLGANGDVSYAMGQRSLSSFGSIFSINRTSGKLKLNSRLNFDRQSRFNLQILARDRGIHSRAGYATVVVRVINVNDHAPVLSINGQTSAPCPANEAEMMLDIQFLQANIAENNRANSFVASFTVVDGDGDRVNCAIEPPLGIEQSHSIFALQEIRSGPGGGLYTLSAGIRFDREELDHYSVTVGCTDNGNPSMSSRTQIIVTITDTNDHAPTLQQTELYAFVSENSPPGTELTPRLHASDLDIGENARITYAINDSVSWVDIDPSSGVLTLTGTLDYEATTSHIVRLMASDNGVPPKSVTAFLYISVTDTNDEVPLFNQDLYTFTINEGSSIGSTVGTVVAYDRDSTAAFTEIEYFLTSTSEQYFSINRTSGTIKTLGILDREQRSQYTLLLGARNPGEFFGLSSTATAIVNITDINDNAPYITYPSSADNVINLPKRVPENYAFAHVTAVDLDAGVNSRLSFYVELTPTSLDLYPHAGDLFRIDRDLGLLSVTRELEVYQHTIFILLITVSDQGTPQLNSSTDLTVIVNASMILPPAGGGAQGQNPDLTTPSIQAISRSSTPTHTIVIICLGVLTFIFVVGLLIAIFMVRRNSVPCDDDTNTSPSRHVKSTSRHPMPTSGSIGALDKRQYDPNNEYDPATIQRGSTTDTFRLSSASRKRPMDNVSQTGDSFCVKDYRDGDGTLATRPVAVATYRQITPNRMSQLLVADLSEAESQSECSAESSNTDSGKGFSDDGDSSTNHRHPDQTRTGTSNLGGGQTPAYRTVQPRRTPSLNTQHMNTTPQRRTPSMRLPPYNTPIPQPPPPPQARQLHFSPAHIQPHEQTPSGCGWQSHHRPAPPAPPRSVNSNPVRQTPDFVPTSQLTMLPMIQSVTSSAASSPQSQDGHKNVTPQSAPRSSQNPTPQSLQRTPQKRLPYNMLMDSEV